MSHLSTIQAICKLKQYTFIGFVRAAETSSSVWKTPSIFSWISSNFTDSPAEGINVEFVEQSVDSFDGVLEILDVFVVVPMVA